MKYSFDSTFLELGFIKELLKEFNLPNVPVATDDTKLYPGMLYVKDLGIYRCLSNGKLKKLIDYYFNRSVFNLSRNMSVTSSVYNTDIHEYLGEYLRFIRDYKHVNLMSLYNCFSNRTVFPLGYDSSFNYYAIPVKFGQVYTIGFDSTVPIELYCTLWNNVFIGGDSSVESFTSEGDSDSSDLLIRLKANTRKVVSGCSINKPFIYTKLKDLDATEYINQWNNVRLIIKMPLTNDTSITVLEGDYIFNTKLDFKITTDGISSYELKDSEGNDYPYHERVFPTDLSLFGVNDGKKHPFADRLIEYLLDTAITPLDKLDENIKRVQRYLVYLKGVAPNILFGVWDYMMNDTIYSIEKSSYIAAATNYIKKYINHIDFDDSAFSDSESTRIKEKLKTRNLIDVRPDLLTYVDKDIEGLFLATGVDEDEYMR